MNPANEVQASTSYRPAYTGSKPGSYSHGPEKPQRPWMTFTPTPSQSTPAQTEATDLQDSMTRPSLPDAPETQRGSVNRASGFRAADHEPRGGITMPPQQSEVQHRIQLSRKAATCCRDVTRDYLCGWRNHYPNQHPNKPGVPEPTGVEQYRFWTGPRERTIEPPWQHPATAHWKNCPWLDETEPQSRTQVIPEGESFQATGGLNPRFVQGGQSMDPAKGHIQGKETQRGNHSEQLALQGDSPYQKVRLSYCAA